VIVGAIRGTDPEYGVPVFRGPRARRALVALFGLPNSAPTREERERLGPVAWLATRRLVFVDDWNGGRPRAVWLPDASAGASTERGRGAP
jgi:hypothetical protein